MDQRQYALVLTGTVLPGYDPASVWPALAEYFRMDLAELTGKLLPRAPLTVKESPTLAKIQTLLAGCMAAGADAQMYDLDERGSLFVLVDNIARGPMAFGHVEEGVRLGSWPASVSVAKVGSSDWQFFSELSARAPAQAQFDTPPIAAQLTPPQSIPLPIPSESTFKPRPPSPSIAVAMPTEGDELPPGEAIHAGFWRRFSALAIDSLVLVIPILVLGLIPLLGLLLVPVAQWLYFALMESSAAQATLGKRAMGLKVCDSYGARIGFGRATARYFSKILSAMILSIGFFLAGWTARKQALHDLLAGCCVVFRDVEPDAPLPTVRPPMPWYGWVINGLSLLLVPISIIAALAIPAYQEYGARVQSVSAYLLASTAEPSVLQFLQANDRCPQASDTLSGFPPAAGMIEKISAGTDGKACSIIVTFARGGPLGGAEFRLTLQSNGDWKCSGSFPERYLPADCR
jgi:uncharacterized RDD family membrane protein YckC